MTDEEKIFRLNGWLEFAIQSLRDSGYTETAKGLEKTRAKIMKAK